MVLGDMAAGTSRRVSAPGGRGGARCELFWHLQENSTFCRNVEGERRELYENEKIALCFFEGS